MKYKPQDILTPANAITLLGLVLSVIGSFNLNRGLGLGLVIVGRMLDLVDGPVARASHHTTKFSIIFDPIADKLALASIIIAVIHFQLAPMFVIFYIVVQNAVVSYLSIKAERQNKAVGAVIPGKLNMFFQTSAIMLFIWAHFVSTDWSVVLKVLAYTSFILSLPLGLIATRAYARQTTPKQP
jgi:phosphatidylglycerophosphate synthase